MFSLILIPAPASPALLNSLTLTPSLLGQGLPWDTVPLFLYWAKHSTFHTILKLEYPGSGAQRSKIHCAGALTSQRVIQALKSVPSLLLEIQRDLTAKVWGFISTDFHNSNVKVLFFFFDWALSFWSSVTLWLTLGFWLKTRSILATTVSIYHQVSAPCLFVIFSWSSNSA